MYNLNKYPVTLTGTIRFQSESGYKFTPDLINIEIIIPDSHAQILDVAHRASNIGNYFEYRATITGLISKNNNRFEYREIYRLYLTLSTYGLQPASLYYSTLSSYNVDVSVQVTEKHPVMSWDTLITNKTYLNLTDNSEKLSLQVVRFSELSCHTGKFVWLTGKLSGPNLDRKFFLFSEKDPDQKVFLDMENPEFLFIHCLDVMRGNTRMFPYQFKVAGKLQISTDSKENCRHRLTDIRYIFVEEKWNVSLNQ